MELQILDVLQRFRFPLLDRLMVFVSSLGNAGMVWIALAIVLILVPKTRKTGIVLMVALCMDVLVCNGLLKHWIHRIRPCDVNRSVHLLVARPTDSSFPSGHTAASFASVAALYLCRSRLFKPALVLACLIAVSRMFLYVHYPTDILGGLLVGIGAGYLAFRSVQSLEKRIRGVE